MELGKLRPQKKFMRHGNKKLTFFLKNSYRNRDKLPVVAKLSHQVLRLEREYHIVQRLYRQSSAKEILCKPLDKITLENGLIAFIYEDYGNYFLRNMCGKTY